MTEYFDYNDTDYIEKDLNNIRNTFQYDLHYKNVIDNKLTTILLLKRFNVNYGIDNTGKIFLR